MADWTEQDPNSLLPGQPWTSAKALAAFENPVAIAEGAADAPRLYLRALEQLTAGDELRAGVDGAVNADVGATVTFSIAFAQTGTVRVSFEHQFSSPTISRLRVGVSTTLHTFANPSDVWTARTADVDVLPGDQITISATNSAGSPQDIIRLQRFSTGGEDIWPAAYSPIVNYRAAL